MTKGGESRYSQIYQIDRKEINFLILEKGPDFWFAHLIQGKGGKFVMSLILE